MTVAANMAEDDTDALVAKISEGVFAKLNSCLDTKLDQILKSVNSVCEKVKAVEQRVVIARTEFLTWKTLCRSSKPTLTRARLG